MKKDSGLTEYYKLISAMGKLTMQEKKANGETMHLAPLGYKNVRKDGRSTIEPDPKTFPLVQEAKELRKQGWTIRKICKLMERQGLLSKRGNVISAGAMQRIVSD